MTIPSKSTAKAFPRYTSGRIEADSTTLQWPGIFARRMRFPPKVDRFLVPATPEPLFSCIIGGTAHFRERDLGKEWIERQLGPGDIFVTHSKDPYELLWSSPPGQAISTIVVHFAVDRFLNTMDQVYPGQRDKLHRRIATVRARSREKDRWIVIRFPTFARAVSAPAKTSTPS